MKRAAFALILFVFLAAACAPQPQPALDPSAPPAPTPSGESAAAQAAALAQLAEALGLPAGQITVISAEAVEWPDSCLGISYPNARCAQAVTPGYRVALQAGGIQYEVHTNADGSSVALAVPRLTWHREGGIAGFCDDLTASGLGDAQASSCRTGEPFPAGELTEAELAQLNEWATAYSSVVIESSEPLAADGLSLVLTLTGAGNGQPSEADRQVMLAWAQAVYERLAQ